MYRTERNYENLNKGIFPGAGRFDIPILRPELTTAENWISFNYAKGCEEPLEHGVHFFVDDYQFNRIWAHPDNYLGMMALFMAGYNEMLRRLQPAQIIFYGKVPAGCEGNIFHVTAFQEKLKARIRAKKESTESD